MTPDENAFLLSPATADALEFPTLQRLLAHLAATDLGRDALLRLRPAASEEELRRRRRCYADAERLVTSSPLVPSVEQPVRPLLDALDAGGYKLTGRDVVALADVLGASSDALRRIRKTDEEPCAALAESFADVEPLDDLLALLRRTFDSRGEVRENATPRLAALRDKIRGVRQRAYSELGSIVERQREHLSEDTIPLRGGRLVLMLQSGARGKVPGLVHGRSQSGRSFYFEPLEAVELNNDLQQAVDDEEAERRRLLQEVVDRLRADLDKVHAHARMTAELDRQQAAVRYAQAAEARLAELAPRHELNLRGGRHPLLDPRLTDLRREALGQAGHDGEVVGLDLELDADQRAVVVTGPNAGGKTVALKTVGLLVVVHQCGLPVPVAAGSRLPSFDAVVATVGDEQDLLTDRSTFSGRLLRLKEAWEAASPDALILLDELGSGTDPEEGAALSRALLEALVERRSLLFVTTHLSQVAAAALEMDGALCAAMEFDPATGRPTYRLCPGPPGGSEAIALARRLGLPAAWIERAEALVGSEHLNLRRLLAEVERVRAELHRTREQLDGELADAERLRERLATEESALRKEREQLGKTMKRELDTFRDTTRRKLRDELEKLRGEVQAGRRKGLVTEAEARLFEEAPALPTSEEEGTVEVAVGGRVRHRRQGWEGTLEKLDRGRAQVHVSGKVFRCKAADLVGLGGQTTAAARVIVRASSETASDDRDGGVTGELNLVGQRVEPALQKLERYLDQAMLASYDTVRIVHGHGSGQLRRAVRESLGKHPAVRRWEPGGKSDGGDGATVVHFG